MVSIFEIIAGLLTLTALFAWLNHRWLGLPNNVGLLLMGLLASLVLVGLEVLLPNTALFGDVHSVIEGIDFPATLLNGMLAFLFSPAPCRSIFPCCATEPDRRRHGDHRRRHLHGGRRLGVWWVADSCRAAAVRLGLVFGALISPTDPVAVLSMLKPARCQDPGDRHDRGVAIQ